MYPTGEEGMRKQGESRERVVVLSVAWLPCKLS